MQYEGLLHARGTREPRNIALVSRCAGTGCIWCQKPSIVVAYPMGKCVKYSAMIAVEIPRFNCHMWICRSRTYLDYILKIDNGGIVYHSRFKTFQMCSFGGYCSKCVFKGACRVIVTLCTTTYSGWDRVEWKLVTLVTFGTSSASHILHIECFDCSDPKDRDNREFPTPPVLNCGQFLHQ